jgi:hypothetical protein
MPNISLRLCLRELLAYIVTSSLQTIEVYFTRRIRTAISIRKFRLHAKFLCCKIWLLKIRYIPSYVSDTVAYALMDGWLDGW